MKSEDTAKLLDCAQNDGRVDPIEQKIIEEMIALDRFTSIWGTRLAFMLAIASLVVAFAPLSDAVKIGFFGMIGSGNIASAAIARYSPHKH